MQITLVRHGQTEANHQNFIQGRTNQQLNDTGRRQCHRLREQLKDVKFSFCYMSPMIRTVETAFILIGDRVETFPDTRLIERDLGELEGGSREAYDVRKYWDYDLNCSDSGVESVVDLFARCQDFLNYVMRKHPHEHILVVSHGAVIRALYHLIQQHDLHSNLLTVDIENCYCKTFTI